MRTLKNLLAVKCVWQLYLLILKKRCTVFHARQLKKKINKSRGLFMGPSTFFRTAFVSGWSKAPATFKRVTFRSDLFSTVTVNVFFSPFTTS